MTSELVSAETALTPAKVETFPYSYLRNETVFIMPVVSQFIPLKVHIALRNAEWLMNTRRVCLEPMNMEVGAAYEEGFGIAMDNPACVNMPFVFTHEQDNTPPKDVYRRLFARIWRCPDCDVMMPNVDGAPAEEWICRNGHRGLDAVGGLYFTKSIPRMPMAYGDVAPRKRWAAEMAQMSEELQRLKRQRQRLRSTAAKGKRGAFTRKINTLQARFNQLVHAQPNLDFLPLDVTEAQESGAMVEVIGLAMGCTLFRKALFRKVSRPWFKTAQGDEEGAFTQDLYFCRKAKEEAGARFAVDCSVLVGHLDMASGMIY